MSELGERFRTWANARHLAQFGIVLLLAWLVFLGTDVLAAPDPAKAQLSAIEVNVATFGSLFAVVFHFFGRDRISLAVLVVFLALLLWFTLTGGSDLPQWLGMDQLV